MGLGPLETAVLLFLPRLSVIFRLTLRVHVYHPAFQVRAFLTNNHEVCRPLPSHRCTFYTLSIRSSRILIYKANPTDLHGTVVMPSTSFRSTFIDANVYL